MIRIVFDTNVLISATVWQESVAQKALVKLLKSGVEIYSSNEILDEYQRVLRNEFNYTENEIIFILEKLISFLHIIKPGEKVDIVKEDPDDNKIIECALASQAEYILTYDKHLLSLNEIKAIKIVKPETFLKS